MSPYDVERVEILKGPSASIYGSRGGNGVIAIYTLHGEFMRKGGITFQMLGYYTPRKFYENFPGTAQDNNSLNNPETCYWNPDVVTDKNGTAIISVKSIVLNEDLIFTAEGISENNHPGFVCTRIP